MSRLLALLVAVLLAPAAHAHPFALRVVAHQVVVTIDRDDVRVVYTVEVPLQGEGGDPSVALPDELADGIRLELDGARVPLEADPLHDASMRSDGHTFGVRLHLAGTLAGDGTLTLSNHNYPDLQGYFSTEFRVAPGWQVLDGSLLEREDGRIVKDRNGRWGAGDDYRVATLTVRRAPLAGWVDRLGGQTDPIAMQHAVPVTIGQAWLAGGMTPLLQGLLLALGALLGALARTADPPARAWPAAALLAVLAALAPPLHVVAVSLSAAALVACAWSMRKDVPWIAPLAAAVALVAAAGRPGWTVSIAIGVAVGSAVSRPAPVARTAVVVPSVLVALVALARGLGGPP